MGPLQVEEDAGRAATQGAATDLTPAAPAVAAPGAVIDRGRTFAPAPATPPVEAEAGAAATQGAATDLAPPATGGPAVSNRRVIVADHQSVERSPSRRSL